MAEEEAEEEETKMNVIEVTEKVKSLMKKALDKEIEGVVGVQKEDDEWIALVDILERKSVPDTQDLLGRYEVKLSEDGELVEYEQKTRMQRTDREVGGESVE